MEVRRVKEDAQESFRRDRSIFFNIYEKGTPAANAARALSIPDPFSHIAQQKVPEDLSTIPGLCIHAVRDFIRP